MITRLQEENAKLRQTSSAPKSDFTFSVPSVPAQTTAPAFSASASPPPALNKDAAGPSSYNNNDILAFLSSSSAAPPQPTQTPFTMINPSPPPAANNASSMNSIDDFMMNWNSSAFGTELPQAVPPSVTNLTEQPANTDFASLWNSLNQGNNSTFSTLQNQQSQQQSTVDNNNFFSLFHNAFTPSLDGQAPAVNSNPAFSQYVNSANTAPYNVQQNSQNVANNMFPFASANASSSASPSSGSTGHTNPQPHHQNSIGSTRNSSSADSPETCASSTSGGSDPSDAQPSTPNNGQVLFAGNNKQKSKSGDNSNNLYPDMGFSSLGNVNLQDNNNTGSFGSMFGNTGFESVTTPSGVFDMMNYRDPLLGNLDGNASGDNFNFGSFNPGNNNVSSSSGTGTNNNQRSDTLDFSEFLVASPPSSTTSPPVTGNNFFQMPGNNAKDSNSSSSLPTLGSLSNGPSPQSSINTASGSSGTPNNGSGTHNWLPYDIPYNHPLIQHVMKDQLEAQKARKEFENQMSTLSGKQSSDIDGLCTDMTMKATCKDHARERIAQALQTDEQTMKLYNEYLASAGQNTAQQTPSPNLK
ncbi:hypothetical protein P389DRAFT_74744 [Cystobasidium minutum MCA 4210]|uniref:uncharacterized protein n=1 Tax=Cystobasidium minutum MCA 4210 TaxID=1397322 RepID=UPI0034CF4CCD|eukprot:jgi/Rhomi1/74744/CE74743_4595